MRIPPGCDLRPAYTGWFADFANLARPRELGKPVSYGEGGRRFAGATFDASASYRAKAVMDHWDRLGLTVPALHTMYQAQTRRIIDRLSARAPDLPLVSSTEDQRRGGFVTVRHARASEAVARLRERGVLVDARSDLLRVGPAPYLLDEEIDRGVDIISETISGL
jgi:kynureninase